jgi:hypothetical protein
MKYVFALILAIVIFGGTGKVSAQNWLNWNWTDYSNSALLTESGDFTKPWWWWFRPERRPTTMSYVLLNHSPNSWLPTYNGCAFVPNGKIGKKFTFFRQGIEFEYYLYENVGVVGPVSIRGANVIAQTKGPRLTGGFGACGVRLFLPKVPVVVKPPF